MPRLSSTFPARAFRTLGVQEPQVVLPGADVGYVRHDAALVGRKRECGNPGDWTNGTQDTPTPVHPHQLVHLRRGRFNHQIVQ